MTSIQKILLIHNEIKPETLELAQQSARGHDAEFEALPLDNFLRDPVAHLRGRSHVVSLLESTDLSLLLDQAHRHGFSIGLLPAHKKTIVCRLFNIPSRIDEAVPLAIKTDRACELDLLLCNGEAVLLSVMVGYVPFFSLRQHLYERQSSLKRLAHLTQNIAALSRLKPFDLCITTEKYEPLETAITGVLIIENDVEAFVANLVDETISSQDGKLSAMLVAPSSIVEYLRFLWDCMYYKHRITGRLPGAVSYIKTRELTLESAQEFDYSLDGRLRKAKKLSCKCIPNGIAINVGEQFKVVHDASEDDKETLKIKNLPQHEDRLKRLQKNLPFFSAALEEDFKDLFLMLRDNARLSGPYLVLMILSSMLATFGLFLNSAPVVIGAMILAPLMGPIVSLSMALLRNDKKLLDNALWVFFIGLICVISVAALTTLILPYEQTTGEIRARLQPSLLDLGVAIVSGIAAAYTHAKESVLKSLPGVAIAVALVPPLCVTGIGLAWLDWNIISGAGLLFLTNLSGIALAGALTFLMLGFSSVLRVNRGLGFFLLLAALISVPLYHSLMSGVTYNRISRALGAQSYDINGKTIELRDVKIISTGTEIRLSAALGSSEAISPEDVETLRSHLEKQLERTVRIEATSKIIR